MSITHQVFMLTDSPGKGVLLAFLTNAANDDLVPGYVWTTDTAFEFVVALDNAPPPNSGGNTDGWVMATWATEEQADAFVNDVEDAMPQGLANQVEITAHLIGTQNFDEWLLSLGFYRKEIEDV